MDITQDGELLRTYCHKGSKIISLRYALTGNDEFSQTHPKQVAEWLELRLRDGDILSYGSRDAKRYYLSIRRDWDKAKRQGQLDDALSDARDLDEFAELINTADPDLVIEFAEFELFSEEPPIPYGSFDYREVVNHDDKRLLVNKGNRQVVLMSIAEWETYHKQTAVLHQERTE